MRNFLFSDPMYNLASISPLIEWRQCILIDNLKYFDCIPENIIAYGTMMLNNGRQR